MIGFVDASKLFFARGFEFNGRSSRAEYWWSYLMIIIVMVVASLLGEIGLMFAGIFLLFILIPSFAIGIRRLHDTDKSGWWLLIGIIPLASLVLFIFFCLRGTTGPNRFGDDPYGGVPADIFS